MLLILVVYWQSFSRMASMWSLGAYQHGWLVYPVALLVLWRKRHELESVPLQGSWLGVAASVLVVFLWIVARAVSVQAVEFASATLLILTTFWAVAGTRAMQKVAFPLALLLTAVPAYEFLIKPLMEATADVATALLYLSGTPVYRDGLFLTLPGGSFEVAKVCSGLRYVLAGTMASLAYAYVAYAGVWKRVLFVAIAAATLALANGLRAFIVMYVASATQMRIFVGEDHVTFGLVLFAVVFFVLIVIGERYADRDPDVDDHDHPGAGAKGGISTVTVAVILLVVAAGPAFEYAKAHQPVQIANPVDLPELPGCRGPGAWDSDWSPDYRGADYQVRGSFACRDYRTSVYVASYAYQEQDKELINSRNRVWPYAWRQHVDEANVSLALHSGSVEIREAFVQAPDRRVLIWYWYQVGDSLFVSEPEVKLANAVQALTLRPTESSIIAIGIEGPDEANMGALRNELEPLARAVMTWNRGGGD